MGFFKRTCFEQENVNIWKSLDHDLSFPSVQKSSPAFKLSGLRYVESEDMKRVVWAGLKSS